MMTDVLPDARAVAKQAASFIAEEARSAVAARGRFLLALSGGKTPWKMLQALAKESVPWAQVHIFQVDERVSPEGHPDRNLTTLREILLTLTPLGEDHIHPMPVEEDDLEAGASHYAESLRSWGGTPPSLILCIWGSGRTATPLPFCQGTRFCR
jgi:6-phosphogluconolactonase